MKEINYISELHDTLKDRADNPLSVYIGKDYEKEWYLSGSYYIEDDIAYFELTDNKDEAINCDKVIEEIYNEALDDCWNEPGYDCYNSYKDCEVKLATLDDSCNVTNSYAITDFELTSECNDYRVYLYTEEK